MTIFGVDWHGLRLEHVRAFLDGAEAEPLLWEAKGTEIDGHEVRRQVGAFANSHEGGYLIIGADHSDGAWVLDGVEFPDEPPAWVSSVVADGVRPRPVFDVHHWPAEESGRYVAVVRVEPVAVPPCIVRGTVYERLPGRTVPIKESLRLADLFARGDQAHEAARERVGTIADRARLVARDQRGWSPRHTQIVLGVIAVAYRPDIGSRLFSRRFSDRMFDIRTEHLTGEGPDPTPTPEVQQDTRIVLSPGNDQLYRKHWALVARWDGAVGIHSRVAIDEAGREDVLRTMVGPAWKASVDLVRDLAGYGPAYAFVRIGERHPVSMLRGPLALDYEALDLASIGRELDRSLGIDAFEPDPDESG